jgi:hypothetical protein
MGLAEGWVRPQRAGVNKHRLGSNSNTRAPVNSPIFATTLRQRMMLLSVVAILTLASLAHAAANIPPLRPGWSYIGCMYEGDDQSFHLLTSNCAYKLSDRS